MFCVGDTDIFSKQIKENIFLLLNMIVYDIIKRKSKDPLQYIKHTCLN